MSASGSNKRPETGDRRWKTWPQAPAGASDTYGIYVSARFAYIAYMKGDDIAARLVVVATSVTQIVDALPDTLAGRHVAGQLLRAGTSPGANYEEARGAESRRDFAHKLGVAQKELQDTRYWLRLVVHEKLAPGLDLDVIPSEVESLVRILGASRRTALSRMVPPRAPGPAL